MSKEENFIFTTPEGTFSFLKVFKAEQPRLDGKPNPAKKPQFSTSHVYAPGTDLTPMKKVILAAAYAKFGEETAKKLIKAGSLRLPWKSSDDDKNGESLVSRYGFPYEEGSFYISPTRLEDKGAPQIIDKKGRKIINPDEFYSGCKGYISVYCYAYDTSGNKGVTLYINSIMKSADGERLGGASSPQADFAHLLGAATTTDASDDEEDFLGL